MGLVPVILISGMSGSGKSELATDLGRRLEGAVVLRLDEYYLPLTHLPLAERAATNFDHPDSLDWALMRRHVEALKAGRAVDVPVYDFARHDRQTAAAHLEPGRVVIAEGLLGLHDAALRELAYLTVYVDTPPEVCLRRRIARDVAERGRTVECVNAQWTKTVWPMAREFILPSRRWARVVVSGERAIEESSDAVIREMEMSVS